MSILVPYLVFFLKVFTIAVACLVVFAGIISLKRQPKSRLEITPLNKEHNETKQRIQKLVFGKKIKPTKQDKPSKKNKLDKPNLYLIEFTGDMKASQVEELREAVSALLMVASINDEVVVRLESPGGTVNGYGLAASQLQRIREKNIPLTVCVDKIAASGGYLMACVANKILAAPFAIIGSIGVVAQLPNFHRLLKKNDIDVELLTAGDYKRTLTVFGENTSKGRKKFQEDLDKIHYLFMNFILSNREQVDINQVATGEHWLATDALNLNLIDELKTSDDYLFEKMNSHQLFKITIYSKPSLADKLFKPAMKWLHPWG